MLDGLSAVGVPVGESYEATAAAVVAERDLSGPGRRGRPPDGGAPGGLRRERRTSTAARFETPTDSLRNSGRSRMPGSSVGCARQAAGWPKWPRVYFQRCLTADPSARCPGRSSWRSTPPASNVRHSRRLWPQGHTAARPHHRSTDRRIRTRGAGGRRLRGGARRLRRGHDPHRRRRRRAGRAAVLGARGGRGPDRRDRRHRTRRACPRQSMAQRAPSLARHGLAEVFVHGTGHGLGLEVHERPTIGPAATATDPWCRGWSSPSNPASTSPAGAACASKTTSS